ncbi:MAG: portal protein, partial [Dehalococcoidia bacterium]|nr:portal protein [Dehalococcoidia bacterium]
MPNATPLPVLLQRLDEDRRSRYRDNLAFYQGSQWPGRPRRGERRLTFNYAKALVDKVTSYLLTGSSLQVEGGEHGAERARLAERAFRAVEQANALAQLDYETELDCAVL